MSFLKKILEFVAVKWFLQMSYQFTISPVNVHKESVLSEPALLKDLT